MVAKKSSTSSLFVCKLVLLVLVLNLLRVIRDFCLFLCVKVMKRNSFLLYLKRCPEEEILPKTLNKKIAPKN